MMDMPTTVPRASIAEVERDLRVRDAVLRGFPEVWQVVGKAGRAETPTDPSPLDMIETVINLRDHAVWPKRKLRFDDAVAQTRAVLDALEAQGSAPASGTGRRARGAGQRGGDDRRRAGSMRRSATWRCAGSSEFRPELGRALVGEAIDALLGRVEPAAVARKPTPAEREALIDALAKTYGDRLAVQVLPDDVTELVNDAARRLIALGVLRDRPDLLAPPPTPLERAAEAAGDVLGFAKPTLFTPDRRAPRADHEHRLEERIKSLNWELFDRAVGAANWTALEELSKLGTDRKLAAAGRGPGGVAGHPRRRSTSRSPSGCCSGRRRRPTWSRR